MSNVVVQKSTMPKGWGEVKLGEICDIFSGGTPKTGEPEFWNGDIPWLAPPDFTNAIHWVSQSKKSITELGLKNSSTRLLQYGDVIISARGTVGALAQIKKPMAFSQTNYGLRANPKIADAVFFFYAVKNSIKKIKQFTYGAIFDTITTKTFNDIHVFLPPIPEQKVIAEILGSLDDKIDLLYRQNKTLENMAQTLFHKWFMGDVDNDWKVLKLSDIAEIKNGYSFSNKNYIEYTSDALEVLKMGHIKKGGGLRTNPKKDYAPRDENLKRHILNKGDIVMAMTDMKDNVVILGVPAMTDKNNHYVLNQRVARIYLKANDKLINNYLLYIQLKDKNNIAILQSKANRGVQVNLSIQTIRDIQILIPPIQIQQEKGATIADLYLKKENNDCQIRTLEKTRDLLLPKLMSGKIKGIDISDSKPLDKKALEKTLISYRRISLGTDALRRASANMNFINTPTMNALLRASANISFINTPNMDAFRRASANISFTNTPTMNALLRASANMNAIRSMLSHKDTLRNLNAIKNLTPPNMDAFRIPNAFKNLTPPPNMDVFRLPNNLPPPNMDAFRQERIKNDVLHIDVPKKNVIPYQFPEIDLEKLNIDDSYREIIEQRTEEINRAIEANILLPAIIYCGSILEILLYDTACKHSEVFKKAAESLKNVKNVKNIQKWTLYELIETSYKVGVIKLDTKELSHFFIRNMRNYVHIPRQVSEGYETTSRTVKFSFGAMQAVIEDLTKFKNKK